MSDYHFRPLSPLADVITELDVMHDPIIELLDSLLDMAPHQRPAGLRQLILRFEQQLGEKEEAN
ncbi:hypothetical protein [Aliagarivorans taiwanensis]|uniref:hypothetical protein n=1 Tax=Aliagarivorans taiwanensis TaxID=561966 RepID=UPI000417936C|nr:hypothetical protein [Aliagarivorans taiwanensis]